MAVCLRSVPIFRTAQELEVPEKLPFARPGRRSRSFELLLRLFLEVRLLSIGRNKNALHAGISGQFSFFGGRFFDQPGNHLIGRNAFTFG